MARFGDDRDVDLLAVDAFPVNGLMDGPILSGRAVAALGSLLRPAGELLPVLVEGRRHWWFNSLVQVDALAGETFGDGAEWVDDGEMRFLLSARQLWFRADRVATAAAVFRVPELPAGYLFARDAVLEAASDLIGLRLDLVWSEANGAVPVAPGLGARAEPDEDADVILAKRARARALLSKRDC